jgi:glycosyltransferase involved in cell wall biosynthesis
MPVYNCERTVGAAIESILLQTYENWELLIIEDGSTDRTLDKARQFSDRRIRVISDGRNLGLTVRLNAAIDMSQGDYFARLDGDDVSYPRRLQNQLSFLEEHEGIDLAGCWAVVFGRDGVLHGKRVGETSQDEMPTGIIRSVPVSHIAFFGRLAWFKKLRYAEWAVHFQDQHLLMRGMRQGRIAVLPEILVGIREEGLTIEKQVRYRMSIVRSFRNLCKDFGLFSGSMLVAFQCVKLGMDYAAIVTGLGYRLLQHRAQPVTSTERAEWERVWKSVNTGTARTS